MRTPEFTTVHMGTTDTIKKEWINENKNDTIGMITHPVWNKVSSNWLVASVTVLAIAVSNPPSWMLYPVGIILMALSYAAYRFGKQKVK